MTAPQPLATPPFFKPCALIEMLLPSSHHLSRFSWNLLYPLAFFPFNFANLQDLEKICHLLSYIALGICIMPGPSWLFLYWFSSSHCFGHLFSFYFFNFIWVISNFLHFLNCHNLSLDFLTLSVTFLTSSGLNESFSFFSWYVLTLSNFFYAASIRASYIAFFRIYFCLRSLF